MNYKYFASIRVWGSLVKLESDKFVDMNISKEEAKRIVNFLKSCLDKEENNG